MEKKIKHKRNLGKMTELQWRIFNSQQDNKRKKEDRKYMSEIMWHKGMCGGNRYRNVTHAYIFLPFKEYNMWEIEDRIKYIAEIRKMRLNKHKRNR